MRGAGVRASALVRHGASRFLQACLLAATSIILFGTSAGADRSGAGPPAQLVTIAIPSNGLIPSQWLSYAGPPRANVLLPAGYNPHQRYPLLVVLGGLDNNYDTVAQDGFLPLFSPLDAIVVMPEGGSGWYTDWWNDGQRGGPAWESYFLDDVMPTILAKYPILPGRQYHAIAGASMGGGGSVYLAGRLPGFFGSVASLSGWVDPQYFAPLLQTFMGDVSQAPVVGDLDLFPVDGPPYGFYANGHNPVNLAENLAQTRVFESTGDGLPDNTPSTPLDVEGDVLEQVIFQMNLLYEPALEKAGVDVTYQPHAGGHDIPDFMDEVQAMVAWGPFKPVVTNPSSWANETVATSGQLWDIGYRFTSPPVHVVQFHQVGGSLSISSAGTSVSITTDSGCVITTVTPAAVQIPTRC